MKGGDSTFAPVVPKHEAGRVLTAKYLNDLELSVKGRTPIAGANINIIYMDGGAIISVSGGIGGGQPIALNVCSNGVPSVITVVAFEQ